MHLILQKASNKKSIPTIKSFKHWINTALKFADFKQKEFLITIRIVDESESAFLNCNYRKKNYPTNVLSFNFDSIAPINIPPLGDIIICAPIVIKEAKEQHKTIEAHFAHLTIHGVLHLLGYDHKKIQDAKIMEQLEVAILSNLGYKNPYYGERTN